MPPTMATDYKPTLEAALTDLADLMKHRERVDNEREFLDKRIFQVREGLFGLAILCGTDTNTLAREHPELFPDLISPDTGLSDAVRKALQSKRVFVSPVELRDRLQSMGYDIKKHANVLASIHTTLKRLADAEEVEVGERDGKLVYRSSIKPSGPERLNPVDRIIDDLRKIGPKDDVGFATKMAELRELANRK